MATKKTGTKTSKASELDKIELQSDDAPVDKKAAVEETTRVSAEIQAQKEKDERKRVETIDKVRSSMSVAFYRRWWIEDRCTYAKEWLEKNDAGWFKDHEQDEVMNQIY